MDIKLHFEYRLNLDLTASHIGINKWAWISIETENEEEAKNIMVNNRFDVLPILNRGGTVTKYFSTRTWNDYTNLNLNTINETDKVYYRLSLPDLVRKFNEDKKHFYFLTNYNEVLGLVSFVNLNCQAVYNYLFQIIADIEISIAYFLKTCLKQDEIISNFEKLSDTHIDQVLNDFKKSVSAGKDNSIFEHMYLQTLGITIDKMLDRIPDRQKKLKKFQKKFAPSGIYGELRNIVMHPVRPILNDETTISKLNELFQDYSEIKDLLR